MNESWIEEENKTIIVKQAWIYAGIRQNSSWPLGIIIGPQTWILFCLYVASGHNKGLSLDEKAGRNSSNYIWTK